MLKYFRRHLGWKLFLTYLVVIIIGVVVLAAATEFALPRAFDRHIATMETFLGGSHGAGESGQGHMVADLFASFRIAVTESITLALAAAFVVAVGVSALVSRRVAAPIQEMMNASQRIAQGNFNQRVAIPHDRPPAESDELGQLAHSFNQMATQLEESDILRRQLIGDVAHELRTPLTVIRGSMEGLIDGVLPPTSETYQQVYHEAARLQRLVADLQALSQVEAGAYELHRQPVDLAKLTRELAARLRPQFDDKDVELHVHRPPGSVMASADPDRISQVLVNLMGNALQYTLPGGRVDVVLEHQHETVSVSVKDTGVGIPVEHLPHLFTRFYRVDKSRARASGGSGIGLTIARHLLEAHGGRIWAESEGDGQGSVFTFQLPVQAG